MTARTAALDTALIERLRVRLDVPLVLHGSSGVPDEGLESAVAAGITKVNIATHLNAALTAAVRKALGSNPALVDPRRYLGPR
jgi:fructose-bisphosphate aldolase class II